MKSYEVLTQLLKDRPHKYGCEIGIYKGVTTKYLLENIPTIERYYAVDPWRKYTMYNKKRFKWTTKGNKKTWVDVMHLFFKNTFPHSNRICLLRTFSVDAVKFFDDEYFDWVYIDANHFYPYIKENLELWTPKVKFGGLITGHDYGNPKGKHRGWGIEKAVDEFVEKNNLNLNIEDNYVYWFVRNKNEYIGDRSTL